MPMLVTRELSIPNIENPLVSDGLAWEVTPDPATIIDLVRMVGAISTACYTTIIRGDPDDTCSGLVIWEVTLERASTKTQVGGNGCEIVFDGSTAVLYPDHGAAVAAGWNPVTSA